MNFQILKTKKGRFKLLCGSLGGFILIMFLYFGLTYFVGDKESEDTSKIEDTEYITDSIEGEYSDEANIELQEEGQTVEQEEDQAVEQVEETKEVEESVGEPIDAPEEGRAEDTGEQQADRAESESTELKEAEDLEPVFEIRAIDEDYKLIMEGKSYKENAHVTYDDLRLLNVAYVDFEGETKQGELVVNKVIADDMLAIFAELYEAAYPIEKMRLVDYYDADDDLSMVDNNTSAFNYRVIAGTDKLSNHAYGLAIDINPLVNPYVTRYGIFPPEGEAYADRENVRQGMIYRNDVCYEAFTSRGFIWGGDWSKSKDYQHFDIWIDGINK